MTCTHNKFKKILTHGKKSRGYYVCKRCGKGIKKPKKVNVKRRNY